MQDKEDAGQWDLGKLYDEVEFPTSKGGITTNQLLNVLNTPHIFLL